MSTDTVTIEASWNNTCVRATCALCGAEGKQWEVDLYLAGIHDWVCSRCTAARDPDLADAIEWLWREVEFADAAADTAQWIDVLNTMKDRHPAADAVTADALRAAAQAIACGRQTCGHHHHRRHQETTA